MQNLTDLEVEDIYDLQERVKRADLPFFLSAALKAHVDDAVDLYACPDIKSASTSGLDRSLRQVEMLVAARAILCRLTGGYCGGLTLKERENLQSILTDARLLAETRHAASLSRAHAALTT